MDAKFVVDLSILTFSGLCEENISCIYSLLLYVLIAATIHLF